MIVYPLSAASECDFSGFKESYEALDLDPEKRRDERLFSSAMGNKDWAARREIFEYLVAQGLDVTRLGSDQGNLLHALAGRINRNKGGDVDLFRRLLEWGCDPNQFSPRFGTPFDVVNRRTGCDDSVLMPFVELLVKYGFDVCAPGLAGKRPLEAVRSLAAAADLGPEYRGAMEEYLAGLVKERC